MLIIRAVGAIAARTRFMILQDRSLILASQSPRRRVLLARTGVRFTAIPSDIRENGPARGEDPGVFAVRQARMKAASVARQHPEAVVIGADTIVALDGHVLGKPVDTAVASEMLRFLSGRTHEVITGIVLFTESTGIVTEHQEVTEVTFRRLSDAAIGAYVSGGSSLDKAGAYGIQDGARDFVLHIRGCVFNVIGLPLASLWNLFQSHGV